MRMAMWAGLLGLAAAGAVSEAGAATRVCQPVVVVGPFEAATEVEAKRLTLLAWSKAAEKHGRTFSSWSSAVNKELKCLPGEAGKVRCAARGEPCRIQQPPTKRRFGPPGRPIET